MIYLYPQNLKATANIWLWSIKDFLILCVVTLLSVVLLATVRFTVPLGVVLCFGFLTIRMDETTVLDFLKYAIRYFISSQQYFEWKERCL